MVGAAKAVADLGGDVDGLPFGEGFDEWVRRDSEWPWDTKCVPTILVAGPYRMYFHSHEPNEPPHIHVDRDDQSAKFWLEPVALARNAGFGPAERSE